eukprot:gnl/MRDRNA2_/MRDRNA2_103143_c0_seq1.p1 gnl/MRDRNA2_/MRDRNA2_103143_c0~~gnl/MRDRNA2_/MRDRNA2_103143_c0_seq1.p1  ORF type:complete len:551 (-),score=115.32 gnl/MRDRNA2_/MRDRNA2_103143_c0_seq1:43-1563(-)
MENDGNFPLDATQKEILLNRWHYLQTKTVMEFLKDKSIGVSRILSMPDRNVGAIKDCNGTSPKRPTLIACHDHTFQNIDAWWTTWLEFMFSNQNSCTKKKVPETKKTYEFFASGSKLKEKYDKKVQAMSKDLNWPDLLVEWQNNQIAASAMQMLHLAIFDAILMQGALSSSQPGEKPGHIDEVRKEVCNALVQSRDDNTFRVLDAYLTGTRPKADIVTLVEAGPHFPHELVARYPQFQLIQPRELDAQNSLILLNKKSFKIQEGIMAKALDPLTGFKPDGELTYKAVTERRPPFRYFLIAAYHSNSEGTATTDVVKKLHEAAGEERLVIGMDANTEWNSGDITQEDVCRLYLYNKGLGVASVFQDDSILDATVNRTSIENFNRETTLANRQIMCQPWYDALETIHNGTDKISLREHSATTMKIRSMVNAQPTKGVKKDDIMSSNKLDMNPKDHIVYSPANLRLQSKPQRRNHLEIADYDNTAGMPSVSFPSDHALLDVYLFPVVDE